MTHPQCSAANVEPIVWRYGRKDWGREIWRYVSSAPTFERPSDWIVEPLYSAVPQAAPELRLAASRLTDIITMLDAPDAYNREYIAAVCRSVLSSLSRPQRGPQ